MEDDTPPHRCDQRCHCPVHDVPPIYWPAGDEHTCPDPACLLAHALNTSPSFVNRLVAIHVRWQHGHPREVDGCALCGAEFAEVRALWEGR